MQRNEFLRAKPGRKNNRVIFDLCNLLFPLFTITFGVCWSTQLFARGMRYNPRVVGYPSRVVWNIFHYKFYSPFRYVGNFLKYFFNSNFSSYFYDSLTPALIGAILSILILIFFAILRGYLKKVDNLYGTARWARVRDLRRFGLMQNYGVVLGELATANVKAAVDKSNNSISLRLVSEASLICHSGKTNTLVLAPTRSGKGVSLIIPTLLRYTGSMIVFDPKGENWNITAGFRQKFSHAMRFSPLSRDTIRFNPMAEIRSGDFAYADANQIADILYSSDSAKSDATAEFFSNSAKDITTGVILHVRFSPQYTTKDLPTVLRLMSMAANSQDEEGEDSALVTEMITSDHGDPETNAMITAIAKRLTKNPKERSSVLSTAFSKLQLFEDPLIANAVSDSDFEINDFITCEKPISLYLTVPYAHIDRIAPVFRLLINFMLRKFSEGETQFGEVKLKNHLLFLLDEFPVLGYFPFIAKTMGVLAGYGVTFMIICQALNQIIELYTQNHPFLDHCKTTVVFAPGKIEDAKLFTDAIGKESVVHDNISTSGNRMQVALNNLNLSSQEIGRDLMNPDELTKLPPSDCLIMNHGMPPYVGKKVVYYHDSRFKNKINLPKPESRLDLLNECQGLPSNKKINLLQKEAAHMEAAVDAKRKFMQSREPEKEENLQTFLQIMAQSDMPQTFYGEPDPDREELKRRIKESMHAEAF